MPTPPTLYRDAAGRTIVETRFRVRFFETDAMGIVHHAAYLTWFEEGRSAFTRAIGYPYAQMARDGIALAVIEAHARYHQPARYDEEVIVATCLEEFPSRGMNFSYEVRRAADGVLLASGSTKHVSVDAAGRVKRVPDEMRARITSAAGALPSTFQPGDRAAQSSRKDTGQSPRASP